MPNRPPLRLFRTTAFKLTLIFLAVFTLFAAFLIGYIARNTTAILQAQMREAVDAEVVALAQQYGIGGIQRVARVIELRSHRPGASLYLLTDAAGEKIAGNVETVPTAVLERAGTDLQLVPYVRLNEQHGQERYAALVRVIDFPEGVRVLVGRDVSESEAVAGLVRRSLVLTAGLMVALGLIAWIFVSRRVLQRIDSIADTSKQIIAGDLSGRLQVTGTGDEFDRLAESLNTMLMRIERLMVGLKQVSDNIAHDLKTPLTRMRNRVERTLAQGGSSADYREALQATIEEADQLIKTFNALLLIARAEAGSSDAEFVVFDAAEMARDVFELYEPAAEEKHVELVVDAPRPVMIQANRELIGQALANLVDNALKYSDEESEHPRVVISVGEDRGFVSIRVADNGPGVAADDRVRVTDRFVRLEASRSKPGAGLGLSLVSAVAQLHGGKLTLSDNEPGLAAILSVPGPALGRAA
jgi:signal transduction histidine kinase